MKIIQILNSPHWSGASNYCISVSKMLMEMGHKILIVTQPGKACDAAKRAGLPYDDTIKLNHRNPYLFAHAIKRLAYIYKKFNPDIVSAHMNEAAWLAGFVAKKYSPNSIVARVRTDVDPPKGHFVNQYVYKHWTDHLIVGSQLHKNICEDILYFPDHKISVIYGGVDAKRYNPKNSQKTTFRKEINATDKDLVIAMLARLDEVKGHEYAIEALSILKKQNIKFKFVAIGYENQRTFAWLKELAQKNNFLEDLYTFGLRRDLEDVIAATDIGLLCSVGSEANSRASLEFMASGKPMVASSVGVIPEIIQHNINGLLVTPRSPEQIAKSLIQLIKDPLQRKNMGNNARQRILDQFTLDIFAQNTEKLYKKLICNRF